MPKTKTAKKKVVCPCCRQTVDERTERRHRQGLSIPRIEKVVLAARATQSSDSRSRTRPLGAEPAQHHAPVLHGLPPALHLVADAPAPPNNLIGRTQMRYFSEERGESDIPAPDRDDEMHGEDPGAGNEHGDHSDAPYTGSGMPQVFADRAAAAAAAAESAQHESWPRSRRATVEDCSDEEDEDEGEDEGEGYDFEDGQADSGDDMDGSGDDDEDDYLLFDGRTLEEAINDNFEREAAELADELTEEDLALLRTFAFKTESHMTNATFNKLPYVFPTADVASIKATKARAASLAALKPVRYDCCPNSCCCYTGPHADETQCPYCKEPRYNHDGFPRKKFTYVPFTPRLIAYYKNRGLVQQMRYRHEFVHDPNIVKDTFDASHYRALADQHVVVDGHRQPHKFFDDRRDIALGLSTDGFGPFRRRKKTAWPLILFNYNLPPEIRFHIEHIMCIGVIPGPKKPKDFDSFLWPAIEELVTLAMGVRAYDIATAELFALRAYLILVFGDIPAMSMIMRMKGHNGLTPCRMCNITGLRVPDSRAPAHYVPLDRSRHPSVRNTNKVKTYDPSNLPLRNHSEFMHQAREVQYTLSAADENRLSMKYGIKGVPVLSCLSSLSFPGCFPYDFMHLIYENVLKNLVLLWTGDFKGLDEGSGSYHFQPKVWEAIGKATADSGSTIPGAFGARPPNVADDKSACTADAWSFWMLYLGPVLLHRKFRRPVYYEHFIDLVRLINKCLQFEITRSDISDLRTGFQSWVKKYEQLYYQYSPDRLSTCPVTIHALLHIADSIEFSGPMWASWAFPMERFCGLLQPAIRSRRFPWASIDEHVVATARLSHIKIKYDLAEMLSLKPPKRSAPGSLALPSYPTCVLLPPRRPSSSIPDTIFNKIVICLSTRFGATAAVIRRHFSSTDVEQWGRVSRLDGGDTMNASTLRSYAEDRRDASHVRYDMLVDIHASRRRVQPVYRTESFYGQLQHILVVNLPASPDLGLTTPTALILAAIRTCDVEAHNDLDMHYYSHYGRLEVVDITCLQCLVGRVPVGNRWAIIDRSGDLARAYHEDLDSIDT